MRCIDGLRNMAFNINENLASSRVASLVGEKLQIGKDPKYSQDLIKCFSLWMQTEQFGITFENQLGNTHAQKNLFYFLSGAKASPLRTATGATSTDEGAQ